MTTSFSKRIETHYDHLAPGYGRRWERYVQAEVSWVIDRWPDTVRGGLALDLGCGDGALFEAVRRRRPDLRLLGVDLSSAMLDHARVRAPEARLMRGDVEDLGFTGTLPQAEVVLSLSMLHHLRDIDGHVALLHRLAEPGGVVFLADFSVDGLAMRVAERYFRLRHPYHGGALSQRDLRTRLDRVFPPEATQSAILRPDRFWRVQIYRLSKG